MTSRRSFLRDSAMLSAGLLLTTNSQALVKSRLAREKLIGLQLYTVRDAMQTDAASTLAHVAQIGYNSVEGATYTGNELFYKLDAKAFSALLRQNGLVMPSSHYRLGEEASGGGETKGTLLHDWEKAVEDASHVGIKYMVCAFLSPGERGDLEHYKRTAEAFNKAGETCKKAGIQLCYHNHDFEFIKQNGQYPYEILLNRTDHNLVKMEIDLYWLTKANQDPIALINKYPGRFPLWHIKDMDKTPSRMFTEVGNGTIDFKKIFTHADKAGLKYFFVEQDHCPGDPFASITQSFNYISKNLV